MTIIDKEEVKAEVMTIMMITMTLMLEVPTQEEGLAVWVDKWDPDIVEIPVMVMKTVINIQGDKTVEVTEVVWAMEMTVDQNMGLEVDVANLQGASTEPGVPAIGEPVAMKVVPATVDILKINIWVEVRAAQAAMTKIMVVQAEAIPAWEGMVLGLQANVVDEAAPDINFRRHL